MILLVKFCLLLMVLLGTRDVCAEETSNPEVDVTEIPNNSSSFSDLETELDQLYNNSNVNETFASPANATEEDVDYGDEGKNVSMTTFIPEPPPTTLLPPAADPTEIGGSESKITVEDYCLCDLKVSACDINCCCDPDCNKEDRKVFSLCQQRPQPNLGSEFCFQEQLIFSNHTEYLVEYIHPGAFCIVTDNLPQRTTYTSVQGARNLNEYDILMTKRKRQHYSWRPQHHSKPFIMDPYRDGALIWALNSDGYLYSYGIPISVVGNECEATEPVLYLRDTNSSCHRMLHDLPLDCTSNMHLDARYYLALAVISDPSNVYQNQSTETTTESEVETTTSTTPGGGIETTTLKPLNKTTEEMVAKNTSAKVKTDQAQIKLKTVTAIPLKVNELLVQYARELISVRPLLCSIENSEETCTEMHIDKIPKPVYENSTCRNVLSSINYIFIHNGTDGIYDIQANVYLSNVSDIMMHVSQRFSAAFSWSSMEEKPTFERSGRPGYIRGKPLLMGHLVKNVTEDDVMKEAISLSTNPSHWMHILKGGSNGICNSSSAVTFAVDIRSNCLFQIKHSDFDKNCQVIQQRILKLLLGPNPLNNETLRIASYGDSNVNNPGDWVPILIPEEALCGMSGKLPGANPHFNLVTSMHIEIAYTLQGSLANPQMKVIGIILHFGEAQEIGYHYSNAACLSSSLEGTTEVELISSVSFVDVTKPPIPAYSKPPSIDVKLPYDFFYPFLPSSASYLELKRCLIVGAVFLVVLKAQHFDI